MLNTDENKASAAQPEAAAQNAGSQNNADAVNAMMGPLGALNTAVTVSSTGNPEDMDRAVEVLNEITKVHRGGVEVLVVDQSLSLRAPVVVLVDTRGPRTASYTMLFEGHLSSPLEDRVERSPATGQPFNVRKCAYMLDDDFLKAAVQRTCAEAKHKDVINVGTTVVGSDVAIADRLVMTTYFNTALLSFKAVADMQNGVAPITAKNLANNQLALTAQYAIAPGTTDTDAVGLPVANDFSVTTTVAAAVRQANTEHDTRASTVLAKVNAIVDLVYQPSIAPEFNADPNAIYQGYHKHVIATNIEAISGGASQNRTESLMTFFYAMASLVSIQDSMQSIYDPRYVKAAGASYGKAPFSVVGFEHYPYADVNNAQAAELALVQGSVPGPNGEMSISEALHVYTHQGVAYSADIEICGRLSWATNLLINAATGDAAANASILALLDEYFGGNFTKYFNGPVFVPNPVVVELGHYENEDGTLSDVRDIDYLTVLQHTGASDAATISAFADSYLPGGCNPESVSKRRQIISGLQNNVTFTGQAYRLTLNDGFMASLLSCFQGAAMSITPTGLVADTKQIQRGAGFQGGQNVGVHAGNVFRDQQRATAAGYAFQQQSTVMPGFYQ